MLRRIQNRLGTAGLIVSVCAVVLAIGGTALAASAALSGKQKKEVEKIAKKYAGKPGAPGAAGANGTNGTNGKDGTNGAPGSDGASVTGTVISPGNAECASKAGGVKYTLGAASTPVCNGKAGTFSTEALPPGQTLSGIWGLEIAPIEKEEELKGGEIGLETISYPIRVNPAPTKLIWVKAAGNQALVVNPENGAFVELIEEADEVQAVCPGNAANPQAVAGNVCMYTAFEESATFDNGFFGHPHRATSPDPTSGVVFPFVNTEGEPGLISGSWAVTAK